MEQTFAEREAEFMTQWNKRQEEMRRRYERNMAPLQQSIIQTASAAAQPTCLTLDKPKKSVVRIGDREERVSEARKQRRAEQAEAALLAFIRNPAGFTDNELAARHIGGLDGGRRRRFLRQKMNISFRVAVDVETGANRYSLKDVETAKDVLRERGYSEKDWSEPCNCQPK